MAEPVSPLSFAGADPERFRLAVRAWLEANTPTGWVARMSGASAEQLAELQREWFNRLAQAGLATAHWPTKWGGAGLSLREQVIVSEENARANAPMTSLYTISLYHLPATLLAYGSPSQRERYLDGVRHRGEVWCQGFSEPNAGSDLASLRTRAERRGEVYVVNGQKIWSSYSPHADYCLLLARTDPGAAKKHNGISYFILDMRSRGVVCRPIRQATGAQEFGEVFFDNVEIPVENLIGSENQGWQVAQATLSAERGLLMFEWAERMAYVLERDWDAARAGTAAWSRDDQLRREFMNIYAGLQGLRELLREMLAAAEAQPHGANGEAAALIKVHFSEVQQRYAAWRVTAGGLAAQTERPLVIGAGCLTDNPLIDYLNTFGLTIAGGSNEVLKNVIAERVLDLPR